MVNAKYTFIITWRTRFKFSNSSELCAGTWRQGRVGTGFPFVFPCRLHSTLRRVLHAGVWSPWPNVHGLRPCPTRKHWYGPPLDSELRAHLGRIAGILGAQSTLGKKVHMCPLPCGLFYPVGRDTAGRGPEQGACKGSVEGRAILVQPQGGTVKRNINLIQFSKFSTFPRLLLH